MRALPLSPCEDIINWLLPLSYPMVRFADQTFLNISLFPSSSRIDTAVWMHYMDANKTAGERARRQLHKNAASNTEQLLAATPHKTPTIQSSASHHENYPS